MSMPFHSRDDSPTPGDARYRKNDPDGDSDPDPDGDSVKELR